MKYLADSQNFFDIAGLAIKLKPLAMRMLLTPGINTGRLRKTDGQLKIYLLHYR